MNRHWKYCKRPPFEDIQASIRRAGAHFSSGEEENAAEATAPLRQSGKRNGNDRRLANVFSEVIPIFTTSASGKEKPEGNEK